nr:rhodanese-like domain-containing protein [Candidatus Gracilibacteria bacterium]
MFKSLTTEEFKNELNNQDKILIDLRTDKERNIFGQIQKNQLNIDFYSPNIASQILSLDKSKKYLIYCRHGNRSEVAMNFMKDNGFSWVCDLKGGINTWNG